jgi:hypothetical protein
LEHTTLIELITIIKAITRIKGLKTLHLDGLVPHYWLQYFNRKMHVSVDTPTLGHASIVTTRLETTIMHQNQRFFAERNALNDKDPRSPTPLRVKMPDCC